MKFPGNRVVPSAGRPLAWSLAVLIGAAVAAPLPAQAQGSSSLFAVGESSKSSKPKPKPATAQAPAAGATSAKAVSSKPATKAPVASASTNKKAQGKGGTDRKATAANRRAPAPTGPQALAGRWQDVGCVPLDAVGRNEPLFVRREYQFDSKGRVWQLDANVYNDAHCSAGNRMLTYHGEGTVNLTGRSRVAEGAWDANFRIDKWQATPVSRDGVMALLNARCGSGDFEPGRALDLARTGCAPLGIQPLANRPNELELVRVLDGRFFLGSRGFLPADRDQRPAQLSRYGLERAPN